MPISARVSLGAFIKRVESLPKDLRQGTIKGLQSAAARGVGFVVEEINRATPFPAVDRGELQQSARVEMLPDGARIEVDAPHAAVVELGSRPFTPPLEPLIEWALRKGLAEDEEEAEDIAWGIRKRFQEEGYFPRYYFRKAMARTFAIIGEEVASELRKQRRG